MTIGDWIEIALDIKENYNSYDGFVVIHGTDTMAYSVSALSFMLENLGKSVVFTGSQVLFLLIIDANSKVSLRDPGNTELKYNQTSRKQILSGPHSRDCLGEVSAYGRCPLLEVQLYLYILSNSYNQVVQTRSGNRTPWPGKKQTKVQRDSGHQGRMGIKSIVYGKAIQTSCPPTPSPGTYQSFSTKKK